MRVIVVVPGTRSDKDSLGKPVGAVIAVRGATKRIRGIEAVGADRRGVVDAVTWANLHADGNLGLRIRHGNNQ
jgi:hypothetical protein